MKRLFLLLSLFALPSFTAHAEGFRPDDHVTFDVSAEDWVTTKTAHVTVQVEAAVSGATAGSTRADMMKALDELAKTDWRLTSFSRSQDQTGLERWSAVFEARLPESDLTGLGENAKKLSKAGLQLSIGDIDFSPTLDEMETARGVIRTRIYKIAGDQLAALNAALPGHNYRIAVIDFTGEEAPVAPMPHVFKGEAGHLAMMAAASSSAASAAPSMERAEKITLTARVMLDAAPEGKPMPEK